MTLWLTNPVTQQLSLSPKDGSAIKLPEGERHFGVSPAIAPANPAAIASALAAPTDD